MCVLSLRDIWPSVHLGKRNSQEQSKQRQLCFDVVTAFGGMSCMSLEALCLPAGTRAMGNTQENERSSGFGRMQQLCITSKNCQGNSFMLVYRRTEVNDNRIKKPCYESIK